MDEGIDILLKTKNGMNCLHIAATYGHLNLCKTLLNKHKFDVHMNDNKGFTGLHFSAKNGNYELVKFFVDKGTDILLKTKNGTKCLHLAAKNGYLNLCRTLVNIHVFDVQIPDNKGFTALHYSAQVGNYELVKFFFDEGTDIHLKTKSGINCLHFAAINEYLNLCKTLVSKHKLDVNIGHDVGFIVFQHPTQNKAYELVTFFVDQTIDSLLKTKPGKN